MLRNLLGLLFFFPPLLFFLEVLADHMASLFPPSASLSYVPTRSRVHCPLFSLLFPFSFVDAAFPPPSLLSIQRDRRAPFFFLFSGDQCKFGPFAAPVYAMHPD